MRQYIYILALSLILTSCMKNQNEKLYGSWRLDFNEQIENQFFPFELCFKGDTLFMTDGNNFKHLTIFHVKNDSLEFTFSNGNNLKIKFNIVSDSTLYFDNGKFNRISFDYNNSVPHYELVGYKTDETLTEDINSSIIHLVKSEGKTQVIWNNVITDLRDIPKFLASSNGSPSNLILYLGNGIDFNDLVDAYKWIRIAWINQVTLVTGHETYDKFYVERDSININDSLMDEFLKQERIPPFPPNPEVYNLTSRIIITIKDSLDIGKLKSLNDSTGYLIYIDERIDLLEYLEINERIKKKKNIKKEITAYNTAYTLWRD